MSNYSMKKHILLSLMSITVGLMISGSSFSAETAVQDCQKLSGDQALAACDRAISQNPKDAVSFFNRAENWYWGLGETRKALADYSEAIRLNPKFSEAYLNRGLILGIEGDDDSAI